MKAKYINPFTDFGFKKIFGEEASKPLLMDFLNSLLPPEHIIAELTFNNTELLPSTDSDRRAIYDIYCQNERGEKFIVELQKAKQNFFKERTIYYSTFPISQQAEKGNWNYDLKAVYCIGILDFKFDDYQVNEKNTDVLHVVKLKNQHGAVFYEKLTYIYLEMPNFKKKENELNSRLDQWLYFINNLEDLQQIPQIFADTVFITAFQKAELAAMSTTDITRYEGSLKIYRDLKGVVDTAFDEGMEKGMEKGKEVGRQEGEKIGLEREKTNVALNAIKVGMENSTIQLLTGLSEKKIEELRSNL